MNTLSLAFILFFISFLMIALAVFSLHRSRRLTSGVQGFLVLAIGVWAGFYGLELLWPTLGGKVLAAKLQYLGTLAIPPLWLMLSLCYYGHERRLTKRWILLLTTPFGVLFLSVLTNEWHHLIWREVGLHPQGYPSLWNAGYGSLFWFATLVSYAYIAAGLVLNVLVIFGSSRPYRRQSQMMILAAAIPFLANIAFLSRFSPLPWFDFTPLAFALSAFILVFTSLRSGFVPLVPEAASTIIANLDNPILVVDAEGGLVDLNPAARRQLGLSEEDIGLPLARIKGMDSLGEQKAIGEVEGKVLHRSPLTIERNGEKLVYSLTAIPIAGEEKQRRGVVYCLSDITSQVKHETSLQEANAELQAILEALPDVYLRLDRSAKILDCNLAGSEDIFGPFPSWLGRTIQEVLPNDIAEGFEEALRISQEQQIVVTREFNFRTPNGEKVYQARFSPLLKGDTIVLARDIGQLRRTEEELRRREHRLRLLNEITISALNAPSFQEMLDILANRLGELFDADGAYITLWDERRQLVIPAAAYGHMHQTYRRINPQPPEGTLTNSVLQAGKPLALEDARNSPYVSPHITALFPEESLLALPLMAREERLGAAIVAYLKPHQFTEDEIKLGEQVATQISLAMAKEKALEAERQQRRIAEGLRHSALALSQNLDFESVLKTVLEEVSFVVPYDAACVMVLDPEGKEARVIRSKGYERFGEAVAQEVATLSFGIWEFDNLRWIVENGRPNYVADIDRDPNWQYLGASGYTRSWAGTPIMVRGKVQAILSLDKIEPNFYQPEHLERLVAFASQAGIALENALLHQRMREMALTDALTGVANRRAFDLTLRREFSRAKRFARSLALVLMDIDDFKRYNDTYGHQAGDERLKQIARLVSKSVRAEDFVARYGGDEFVILLADTEKRGALALAERIRLAAQMAYYDDHPQVKPPEPEEERPVHVGYTVDLGVAAYPEDGMETPEMLLKAADLALMEANRRGKNRVCAYEPSMGAVLKPQDDASQIC